MTSLRTSEGLSLQHISDRWGIATTEDIRKESAVFVRNGSMFMSGDRLILTNAGKFLADGIAATLFR